MRGNREVVRFGDGGDLAEHSDTTAVGHVGLGKGNAAGRDHLFELVQGVHVLSGRDRHSPVSHNAGVAADVVGDSRLLKPDEVELLEAAGSPDRLIDAPAHVGVDHDREIVAEMGPHRCDPLEIVPEARAADLGLDGPVSLSLEAVRLS